MINLQKVQEGIKTWPYRVFRADETQCHTGGTAVCGHMSLEYAKADALSKWRSTGVPHYVVTPVTSPSEFVPDPVPSTKTQVDVTRR